MNKATMKSPTAARQASKEGVGRWVLGISTALVIIVMIVLFVIAR